MVPVCPTSELIQTGSNLGISQHGLKYLLCVKKKRFQTDVGLTKG